MPKKKIFLEKPLIRPSPVLIFCWKQSLDFLCKSKDWFLHNCNTGLKWVEISLIYLLTPFTVQKFKKILRADKELWQQVKCLPKIAHLSHTRVFSERNNIILMYLLVSFPLGLFHCAIQSLWEQSRDRLSLYDPKWIQTYDSTSFLGPKWPICPKHWSFRKNHYFNFDVYIGSLYCAKFLRSPKSLRANLELFSIICGTKMFHWTEQQFFRKK